MQRTIQVAGVSFCYTLTRKHVKNLNLRVGANGALAVSAPPSIAVSEIDAFVASRSAWIAAAQLRAAKMSPPAELPPCTYTDSQCNAVFMPYLTQYFPLFCETLGGEFPHIKYRTMKTRWGVCCPSKKQITLNRRLLDRSADAIEYVVLHEYVHFHHPDHGKGFYAELAALMPDYATRRVSLRHF
ncbi:MAG: YgjP-like metallopeptidase domain-containing protein [Pygmaiobacter sp.]